MEKGRHTFGGIVFVAVTSVLFVVNTLMAVLSAFVFTPEINYQIVLAVSNILSGIIFGSIVLAVLVALVVVAILCFFVLCHIVTVFSRLIYCAKLSSHTPHTLAGYYAYRMMQVYPTTITTKHFDFDIYRFNKEQFNKRLADGTKIADNMNELSSLEDKLAYIDNTIDYSMYH